MKLILLGPPGAGKGTHASFISEKLQIPQISTGDMFREITKENSELGIKVKKLIDAGTFVPDDVTFEIVKQRLQKPDCKNGFILDGFPRNVRQAKMMEGKIKIDKIILFDAPDDFIVERLSGRIVCSKCGAIYHVKNIIPKKEGICDKCGGKIIQREDDKPETVKKRLETYHKLTEPLLEYYKGKITTFDGKKNLKEVQKELLVELTKK